MCKPLGNVNEGCFVKVVLFLVIVLHPFKPCGAQQSIVCGLCLCPDRSGVKWRIGKGKGKVIPLQTLTGPEGSRWLTLPDFKTIGT
jgi:hypothetical protein